MKTRKRVFIMLLSLLIITSVFFVGCKKTDTITKETDTSSKETNSTEVNEPTTTADETEVTPTPSIVTNTPEASNTQEDSWNTDKISGTLDAYNKYFNVDMTQYEGNATQLGNVTKFTYYSSVVGADRNAYVYTPYGYSESNSYPVVYLIHGIGCDCEQWVSMNLNNILSNLIEKKEIKPFVAIIPSVIPKDGVETPTLCANNIKAFTDFCNEFSTDLEPYVFEHYAVSQDRKDTAVCGLSMGGMEALSIGFTLLDRFNYIGSFSAAPTLDESLLNIENSEFTPELVLICTGDADNTVGENPRNYHNTLVNNKVDHIWYLYPGGGHSPEVWKSGLVNFLKRTFQ